ncbi:MAG: hypothetical protein N2235_11685 [Fischerella sp.]|nr:hypothetical protein [Fischerella sp.]
MIEETVDTILEEMTDDEVFQLLNMAEELSALLKHYQKETDEILNDAIARGSYILSPPETLQ